MPEPHVGCVPLFVLASLSAYRSVAMLGPDESGRCAQPDPKMGGHGRRQRYREWWSDSAAHVFAWCSSRKGHTANKAQNSFSPFIGTVRGYHGDRSTSN